MTNQLKDWSPYGVYYIFHHDYKNYLFVSNDKKKGDNIVEGKSSTERRSCFVFEPAENDMVYIKNIDKGMYLFVSKDKIKGDQVVEAKEEKEPRSIFQLEKQ
jgi:hypothetical protein